MDAVLDLCMAGLAFLFLFLIPVYIWLGWAARRIDNCIDYDAIDDEVNGL